MNKFKKLIPLFICVGIMLSLMFIFPRNPDRFQEKNQAAAEVNTVSIKKSVLDSLSIIYKSKTNFQLQTGIFSSNIFYIKILNLNEPADFLGKDYRTSGILDTAITFQKEGYKVTKSVKSPYDVLFQSKISNSHIKIPVAILFKLMEQ